MDKEGELTKSPNVLKQNAEDDSKVIKMDEQREEPVVLKTDGGGISTETGVITGQDAEKPIPETAAKSGKENLLGLLGAMKVEVTNKRKLKSLKVKQTYEATPKPKPAAMESTISMFQKATEEASSQR